MQLRLCVSSVERDLHPLTGDCVNGGTRSTTRNTSERGIARNEVKTVYEAKQKNMCVYGHM
jgi:hypothetical protein